MKLNHNLAPALFANPNYSDNIEFVNDLIDLFEGKKSGHLAHYHYSEPLFSGDKVNGAYLWDQVIRNSSAYYQFESENSLIPEVAQYVSALLKDEKSSLIDLGPGSGLSLQKKTLPFINSLSDIGNYIPVDMCAEYLDGIKQTINSDFSDLHITPQQKNYFDDAINFDVNTIPVFLFMSSSISNLPEIDKNDLYCNQLEKILSHMYEAIQREGYLIVSQDTNQDEKSLYDAYSSPDHVEFSLNLLERIKRDTCNIRNSSFDPSAWRYEPQWCAINQCIKHTVIANQDQTVIFNNKTYEIAKNHSFVLDNSHKYRSDDFISISKKAGFIPVKTFMNEVNKVAIHILKRHN